jgi:serine/threonine protein kinase
MSESWSAGTQANMLEFVNQIAPVLEIQVKVVMWQLLHAVAYMHNCEPPVCHRDIKPDNVSGHMMTRKPGARGLLAARNSLPSPQFTEHSRACRGRACTQVLLWATVPSAEGHILPVVKLADFGTIRTLEAGNASTYTGTLEYMAPEMLNHGVLQQPSRITEAVDVYSLGVSRVPQVLLPLVTVSASCRS